MLLALIPYLSISSAGLPLRGTSLTASRLILMSGYSLSPAATASPIPPGTKNVKGTLLIFFHQATTNICMNHYKFVLISIYQKLAFTNWMQ